MPLASEQPAGLIQLYPEPTSSRRTTVDLVAVHGLGGHPFDTWTVGEKLWLRDFVPSSIPDSRIFTFGYDSSLGFNRSVSKVDDFACDILERLRSARRKENPKKPIIFICHSLGGIVVKKMMVIAHERESRYEHILKAVKGILFMGVPHRGADVAYWGKMLGKIANLALLGSLKTKLLEELEPNSKTLGDICSQFVERGQSIKIFTYFERQKTKGIDQLVVDEHSAILHLPNEVVVPMEADHRDICKFLSTASPRYTLVLDHILELVDDEVEDDRLLNKEHVGFLETLTTFDPRAGRDQIPDAYPGTCKWIEHDVLFQQLDLAKEGRLLWISGSAGSGKSVLAKYIASTGIRQVTGSNSALFVFCSRDSKAITAKSILNSLLGQLLKKNSHLFRYVPQNLFKLGHDEISISDTVEAFSNAVTNARNQIFWLIIDSLDEIPAVEAKQLIQSLRVIALHDLLGRLKIVITDRRSPRFLPKPELEERVLHIDLDNDHVQHDVEAYISSLSRAFCSETGIPDVHCSTISSTIITRACGLFLLASVMWDRFLQGISRWTQNVINEQLRNLESIPADLESLYCAILENIPLDLQHVLRDIFTWLIVAREPMTVSDLDCAISIKPHHKTFKELRGDLSFNFQQVIEEYGASFLKISRSGGVQFRHITVKDLLIKGATYSQNREVISRYRLSMAACENQASKSCITVLMFEDLKDEVFNAMQPSIPKTGRQAIETWSQGTTMMQIPDAAPLLIYTTKHWPSHLEKCQDEEAINHAIRFINSSNFYPCRLFRAPWTAVERKTRKNGPESFSRTLPLCHAILQMGDLPDVLQAILKTDSHLINQLDEESLSPLQWSILRSRKKSFNLLLQHQEININIGLVGKDKAIHTALNPVCIQEDLFRSLLDIPILDVNCRGHEGKTALHIIVQEGDVYPKFLELLLDRSDIDLSLVDDAGHTPLLAGLTSTQGRKSTWRLLQLPPEKVDIKVTDHNGTNVLALASSRGWTEVTKLLISRDTSLAYQTGVAGMNLILHAAFMGQRQLLEDLLQATGVDDIRSSANAGQYNLVNLCARQDWGDIVTKLREEYGIESQEQDDKGQTVLHLSVLNGWSYGSVATSDKQKALVNVQDNDGRTPLHIAAAYRNLHALKFLLQEGANIFTQDKDGKTAVHVAAEAGSRAILEIFLDKRIREFGRDHSGRGLLHFISMWEWPSVLQKYCTGRKVIMNIRDRRRMSALHIASIFGNLKIVSQLLEYGANLELKDDIGFTALQHAVRQGHLTLVEFLIERGAKVEHLDKFGRNITEIALVAHHRELVDCLLSKGIKQTQHKSKYQYLNNTANKHHLNTSLESDDDEPPCSRNPDISRFEWRISLRRDILSLSSDKREEQPSNLQEQAGNSSSQLSGIDQNPPRRRSSESDLRSDNLEAQALCKAFISQLEVQIQLLSSSDSSSDPCSVDIFGWTLLHKAAAMHNPRLMDELLAIGADPNIANPITGVTLLHIAASMPTYVDQNTAFEEKILELLLSQKVNPNAMDATYCTPAEAAYVAGNVYMFKALLQNGADPEVRDVEGRSLLFRVLQNPAFDKNDISWVELFPLLISRCDINAKDHHGNTPLAASIRRQSWCKKPSIEMLLNKGASLSNENSDLLPYLLRSSWVDINRIPAHTKLSRRGLSLLIQEGKDKMAMVAMLRGLTPLDPSASLCCYSGNWQILDTVLTSQTDLSQEYLVIDVDRPITPLHYAARFHTVDHIRSLLQHGAHVNQVNSLGETSLMHAADYTRDKSFTLDHERREVVNFLIKSGADPRLVATGGYRKGWSAIDFAVFRGNEDLADIIRSAVFNADSQESLPSIVHPIPSGKARLTWKLFSESS